MKVFKKGHKSPFLLQETTEQPMFVTTNYLPCEIFDLSLFGICEI